MLQRSSITRSRGRSSSGAEAISVAPVFENGDASTMVAETPSVVMSAQPGTAPVEDEVVGGLRKLGLDPAQIKYVLVSHAHYDHVGGAAFLQDSYDARVVISEADWELLGRATGTWRKPKKDMVATDGQKLTLGDTTLTLHLTPGHTLGTVSTLIPVRDAGKPHMAAYWGGSAFNWVANRAAYITPERGDDFWFGRYIDSAQRFRQLAAAAGADVILSNHTAFDG
jgi:metallo-beta-lactamase class B